MPLNRIVATVAACNRRQAISDELQALDDLENLFGWTYRIAQDRALLRLQLAAMDGDEARVARAMQQSISH